MKDGTLSIIVKVTIKTKYMGLEYNE
jgi:hypothetical protein